METEYNFDDIRPYNDSEINAELRQLSQEPGLIAIVRNFFPHRSKENIVNLLNSFHSVRDFQAKIIRTLVVRGVAKKSTKGITVSGMENIADSFNRLFISNHRDIILDSVFLNVILLDKWHDTCEIAIGDNLFVKPWVEKMVRINKSIVVKRNVPVRQMMEVSAKLSAYIRYAITEKKVSVWIAQREGRSKDANDRTQDSLLKMLNMSGKSSVIENMKELNISPITISYEYDPCDYLKAKEFQEKRDNPDYKKKPEDDALNMVTGLRGWKGRVHYHISDMGNSIDTIADGTKNEQFRALAELIDTYIHKNYKIYPVNMIALDLLDNKNTFAQQYSAKEKIKFEHYLQGQLDKIELENKDVPFLRKKILEMYANPFINYLKANHD
ncbi:MAG: 1-acyl-sn-glycerol-3-phosphate acyltransferase [Lachnoclostridium sp.]|jgi:hypothetical protein|nr:1-acyl-sn-glycerol-3-phosphate acyltransferase [Lachnoclostridium sp.]